MTTLHEGKILRENQSEQIKVKSFKLTVNAIRPPNACLFLKLPSYSIPHIVVVTLCWFSVTLPLRHLGVPKEMLQEELSPLFNSHTMFMVKKMIHQKHNQLHLTYARKVLLYYTFV